MELREFWAICDVLWDDVEKVWTPHIATAYKLNSWAVDTQADPKTGAPRMPEGIFHGRAEADEIKKMMADPKIDFLIGDDKANADLSRILDTTEKTRLASILTAHNISAANLSATNTGGDFRDAAWRFIYGLGLDRYRDIPFKTGHHSMNLAVDDFTGNNGDLIHGRNLSGGTYAWAIISGDTSKDTIQSNLWHSTQNAGRPYKLNPDVDEQDIYIQWYNIDVSASYPTSARIRVIDTNNYFKIYAYTTTPDKIVVQKIVASASTNIIIATVAGNQNVLIKVTAEGIDPGTIELFVAGSAEASVAGDNALDHGSLDIACGGSGFDIDNFEAGNLGAPPSYALPMAMNHYRRRRVS